MAVTCATILAVSVLGCRLTSITAVGIGGILIAVVVVVAAMLPIPLYWHERGHADRRESTLVILWAVVLAAILRYPLLIAARLRMPLRDSLFASVDQSLGVNVPAIMQWAARHGWVGIVLNKSYALLLPMLLIAILLPALAGKREEAQGFIVSNGIAFAIAVPLFALFPAVGPWAVYHFAARVDQQQCESLLSALRTYRTFLAMPGQDAGIMCFPSFHVVWAVLSARSLWGFRSLRIPVSVLAALIVISTITTGWHYFVDVLGGLAVALVSILLARAYLLGIRFSRMASERTPAPFEFRTHSICCITTYVSTAATSSTATRPTRKRALRT
jgi:PAP2 superfamily